MIKRIIVVLVCLLFTSNVYAAGEFEADYDLSYAIAPSGRTTVTQQIRLTNLLSNFYPQKYALLIDSDKISQVIAYDDGGIITPQVSVKDGKTEIALTFNTKVVGLGKVTNFTLRYEHAGVANKNGTIWELYIPGVVNDPEIDTYTVSLSVPESFGPTAYLSPLPKANGKWTKEQMIQGGIAGAYGSAQHFTVDLSYELFNDSNQTIQQEIALPPDTAYQHVSIADLTPKPIGVTKDTDGNWLARYEIKPKRSLPIQASLNIKTFLNPRKDFQTDIPNIQDYTRLQEYWTLDPEIITSVATLTTPRQIYDFVVEKLSYNEEKISKSIERLGATNAFNDPKNAVCMEFTDLFIAIARSKGIAARRNVGYAYTDNETLRPLSLLIDVLHTWPEYYDAKQNVWIPIDPTWADTTGGLDYFDKLDFNHIVFAIHGNDSSKPYPAGFYHDPTVDKKDVTVAFAQTALISNSQSAITTSVNFPKSISFWFTGRGEIHFENTSGSTQKNISYTVKNSLNTTAVNNSIQELLPYDTASVPIEIAAPFTTFTKSASISIEINNAQTNVPFTVRPPYLLLISFALGLLSTILLLVRYISYRHEKS